MPETDWGGGRLFAVVGPSGVGKDTVMRLALADLPHVLLVRRAITRPADPHEDHEPCDRDAFRVREEAGDFCAAWDAHGLRYGVPDAARAHVEGGGTAMVNASRLALNDLVAAVPRTVVVELTAPAATRARRLAARGREDASEIERRLARASLDYPARERAVMIPNDGVPEAAARALVRCVREGC